MYIESIAIESFGSYKNFACSFDRGINIIEGPNEAGKTTLGAFIKFIFYGLNRKASQGALAEARRFRSWDNDIASGSLVFEYDGKRYRIERILKPAARANGGESVKIIDLATNSECFKGEHPGKLFFGVEEDAFSQTAYVGQADGGRVNGKTVNAAIENMLFSGDETVSTSAAQKKLDDARKILKYKIGSGGKIADLEDEIDALVRRRESARADNKVLFTKESEKKELSERYEKERDELNIIEKQLERSQEREKLARFEYFDTLSAEASAKEKEYSELLEASTYNQFVPDNDYIRRIEALRTKLSYLSAQTKQTEDDRDALGKSKMTEDDRAVIEKVAEDGGIDKLREKIEGLAAKRKRLMLGGVAILIAALAIAFLAVCAFIGVKAVTDIAASVGLSPTLAGACSAAIGLSLLSAAVFTFALSSSSLKKQGEMLERYGAFSIDEIEELFASSSHRKYLQNVYDEKLSSVESRLKKLCEETERYKGEMDALLGEWGRRYTSPDTPSEIMDEVRELIKKLDEASSAKDRALSARDAFIRTLEGLDRERITKYLEDTAEYGDLEEGTAVSLKLDFERRGRENHLVGEKARQIELEIARLSATAEDPIALSDEISRLSAEKESYELCHDAYMLAYNSISSAADKLRDEVAPRLAMHASSMMRKETKGKYEQLGVDENLSLAYGVDTNGVGNIVTRDIEYLSEGTKDLAYISLRIALVSLLFTKAKPPVLFDESFARLDDNRLENMLATLDDVAKSGAQIFIFTSQKRDAKIMENIGKAKHILL